MAEPTLTYSPACVPYGALALALQRGLTLRAVEDATLARDAPATLTTPAGDVLCGAPAALRYVLGGAEEAQCVPRSRASRALTPRRAAERWIDFSAQLVAGTGFEAAAKELEAALTGRSFLADGDAPGPSDLAVWGALAAAPKWEALAKKLPGAAKWHARVTSAASEARRALADYMPAAARAAKEKVAAAQAARAAATAAGDEGGGGGGKEAKKDAGGSFEIGLKDAVQGGVVTRFPPEPSGFLHIGHAKAALLNEHFARAYQGRLILRFDDTNPSKENDDFVTAIMADVASLGIIPDAVTYTSDHFDALLAKADEMIAAGHLYADKTPVELMRAQRMDGIESEARSQPAAESARLWREMQAGSAEGLSCCLRFRISMSEPNKALRDPVAYRCNVADAHHRTGRRYNVYPTYDCACPFVDAVEGVTHALRTSEYRDREAQYVWIQKAMGLRAVHLWDYSRLNFEFTTLSKRKLGAFVAAGAVDGWDDPRFPTVQGVMRRGLTVPALREFILSQGASKNLNTMSWEKLWTMNKRLIDPVCPRHTAVEAGAGRVLLSLQGVPAAEEAAARTVPRHKKCAAAGEKAQWRGSRVWLEAADAAALAAGEEFTLMDWCNAVVTALPDADGGGFAAQLRPEGDVKGTKLKAHWLADVAAAPLTPLILRELGHLITKRKVEDGDDVAALFNAESDARRPAWGDADMRRLAKGEVLQLERKGYWIVDEAAAEGRAAVLIGIPDGREKK